MVVATVRRARSPGFAGAGCLLSRALGAWSADDERRVPDAIPAAQRVGHLGTASHHYSAATGGRGDRDCGAVFIEDVGTAHLADGGTDGRGAAHSATAAKYLPGQKSLGTDAARPAVGRCFGGHR